jgi:uncharacterized membrane protein YdjX (TVP38/TMEM64 family)
MSELRPWLLLTALLAGLVVVPFVLFEEAIGQALAVFAQSRPAMGAAAAVDVAALALDVVLPVPSTLVTTLAGGALGAALGTAAAWLGMTLGGVAAYGLGRYGGSAVRGRLLTPEQLARAERAAERYGAWALVALRPVPVLAEISAVYAGMVGLRWSRFLVCTALANLGIAAVYAGLGAWAALADSFALAALASIALPGAALASASARAASRRRA